MLRLKYTSDLFRVNATLHSCFAFYRIAVTGPSTHSHLLPKETSWHVWQVIPG
jgi:hypothetical protein